MKIFFLLLVLPLASSGCFWVAVGGAAGEAGYVGAQDDRTAGQTVTDQILFTKVKAKLATNSIVPSGNIEVTVRKGVVTLKGVLSAEIEKKEALAATKAVEGVKAVVDKLYVDK